jgi:hypothetical protein
MDAQWIASLIGNGCFARVPCGANAPVKGDILARNAGNGRYIACLVAGVYPATHQIAIKRLHINGQGVASWGEANRIDGYIDVNGWRCRWSKKVVPKAIPDAPLPPDLRVREVPLHIVNIVKDQYETLNLFYGQKYECPICMDEIFGSNLHITKCGHFFCKDCIAQLPPQWERTDGCPSCRARA